MEDKLFRPLKSLRISVTDRCNFRCTYCMPNADYQKIERAELLSFEEIVRLAKIFLKMGVRKIRLTGGEPLLRNELEKLVKQLAVLPELEDLSLTTNGALLKEKARLLKDAGLARVNVSLDSLQTEKFKQITHGGDLKKVIDGLFTAEEVGLRPVKLNAVVMRGVNDDEIVELVKFSRKYGFVVRFIEYMDVGNANAWDLNKLVPASEILKKIETVFPLAPACEEAGEETEQVFKFLDEKEDSPRLFSGRSVARVGIIGSVTRPFCSGCVRARLTADGKLVTCLFSEKGWDLKTKLRNGNSDTELEKFIGSIWGKRKDRYSEERWDALKKNRYDSCRTKIEMITLGG